MLRRDTTPIKMRNYGRIIQNMIDYACTVQDAEQQQQLVSYIALCMSQKNMIWNRDQECGMERVYSDIQRLSDGKLNPVISQ